MIFLTVIFICFLIFSWNGRYYLASLKYNGPIAIPVIGVTYLFFFHKVENYLNVIYKTFERYDNPISIWLGSKFILIFKNPHHVEKILNSSKFSYKHDIYNLMEGFLGKGLITDSGPSVKLHKRLLQPHLNLQFSSECIPIFEKHTNFCIKKLETKTNQKIFDIGEIIHLCLVDIIGETILGYNFQSQCGESLQYVEAFTEVYKILFERFTKPWLYSDYVFNFSKSGKKYKKICRLKDDLLEKVCNLSDNRRKLKNYDTFVPMIDKMAEFVEQNPDSDFTKNYWFHLITLYQASQDTIALIVSAACLCLGMYPEYQEMAISEIETILGKNSSALCYEDLAKFKYLNMIIKEIYRLFPIAAYILRKNLQNQQIEQWFLPKDCGIMIPIYNLHRDPKYWQQPHHFCPNHFLPENEKKRPNFAYIPFSAGPRSCIGKVFANVSIKVMLIRLLQRFKFEAAGKIPDITFTMDISVRSLEGYKVKIQQRYD